MSATSLETAALSADNLLKADVQEDYSVILERHYIAYRDSGYYLHVGEIRGVQGWILHISVVRWQVAQLLEAIILTLSSTRVAFKIVKNKEFARSVLDGNLGPSQVGKIISIYPEDEHLAIFLAEKLIELTKPFKGPAIVTDAFLGGNVYARYGSFNPIVQTTLSGKTDRFIYDQNGELVSDSYKIPFQLPPGVHWPFSSIKPVPVPAKKKAIYSNCLPFSLLKADAKGNVWKSLFINKYFLIRCCVLKQGKSNMWSDEAGRDMTDRLVWQRKLHRALQDKIPIPRIIDFFRIEGDSYLAMEYIKGRSLYKTVAALNDRCEIWWEWPDSRKEIFVNYVLQLISIVQKFHELGYVHRDITPANFIVRNKKHLYIIDNEMSYSLSSGEPEPPFVAGTFGFMSPEQIAIQTPTTKEDIYGLGATLIALFTGLMPIMFSDEMCRPLREALFFHIQNDHIAEIIASCVEIDPKKRPTVQKIRQTIEQYWVGQHRDVAVSCFAVGTPGPSETEMMSVIQNGIDGLVSEPMLYEDNLWLSKTISKDSAAYVQKLEFSPAIGLYEGIAGVLYFLAKAKMTGFDVEKCRRGYYRGWDFIGKNGLKNIAKTGQGFYGGTAGIALAISTGMNAGLLENNEQNRQILLECLNLPGQGVDLGVGVAGQGVSALQCEAYLDSDALVALQKKYLLAILELQDKGGWWLISRGRKHERVQSASFSFGNSGIVWYILEYTRRYQDASAASASEKALRYLISLLPSLKSLLNRHGLRQTFASQGLLGDSVTGIVVTLIKAYETLSEPVYRKAAEDILNLYPDRTVNENFTQDTGLAGLGEVYLEAYRVFKDERWRLRADLMATFFAYSSLKGSGDSCHWFNNNSTFPTADLMVGNSGILYFLMRCFKKDSLGYRLMQ